MEKIKKTLGFIKTQTQVVEEYIMVWPECVVLTAGEGNQVTIKRTNHDGVELPFKATRLRIYGEVEPQEITAEQPTIVLSGTSGLKITVESIEEQAENATLEVVLQ